MRRSVWTTLVVLVGALALAGCTATETPPRPEQPIVSAPEPADPLPLADLPAYSGIAMLTGSGNCTGTLIDTGVRQGPAYILTNGHCAGDIGRSAQGATLDEPYTGEAEFFRVAGNTDNTDPVAMVQLAYSTMRDTDTAIVRLEGTLGQLEDAGAKALPIAAAEPVSGAHVVNVGVPVHDIDHDDWVLRRGECTLGTQHTVFEFGWLWHDVWSNDCPGILPGSSGSPLVATDAAGAEQIVGMINTTSEGVNPSDGGDCWINRSCQVAAGMVRMVPHTSYAQSVAGIGRCFDGTTGEFSLGGDCPLPISDVWAQESGGWFRGGGEPDGAGRMPQVRLMGREAGTVRTALTELGDGTACTDPATYRGAASHALPKAGEDTWDPENGITLPVDLPADEGHYALCAVRDANYAGAATVVFTVDRTPPVLQAGATVTRHEDGVTVQAYMNPPELIASRYTWGPQGQVDCSDTSDFRYIGFMPLMLHKDDLPATYCVYGQDAAGNVTPVVTIQIPR